MSTWGWQQIWWHTCTAGGAAASPTALRRVPAGSPPTPTACAGGGPAKRSADPRMTQRMTPPARELRGSFGTRTTSFYCAYNGAAVHTRPYRVHPWTWLAVVKY